MLSLEESTVYAAAGCYEEGRGIYDCISQLRMGDIERIYDTLLLSLNETVWMEAIEESTQKLC